jgi:hypothetical protein
MVAANGKMFLDGWSWRLIHKRYALPGEKEEEKEEDTHHSIDRKEEERKRTPIILLTERKKKGRGHPSFY